MHAALGNNNDFNRLDTSFINKSFEIQGWLMRFFSHIGNAVFYLFFLPAFIFKVRKLTKEIKVLMQRIEDNLVKDELSKEWLKKHLDNTLEIRNDLFQTVNFGQEEKPVNINLAISILKPLLGLFENHSDVVNKYLYEPKDKVREFEYLYKLNPDLVEGDIEGW